MFMRFLPVLLILMTLFSSVSDALAGSVLERIKARGFIRSGSVERPGLAYANGHGHCSGLNVDICRAIAAAVLGSPDKIEYHLYKTPKDFDAVRSQQDDVYFLAGSEIAEQKLAGKVLPGPTVFVESLAVMVPTTSGAQHLGDLAGDSICFLIGSPEERSLENYFECLNKNWLRRPFSEEGEMADAYNAQNAHAIAGELTNLALMRLKPGVKGMSSRILPEPLAAFPVMAATGTEDAQWSAIVAWTVHALVSAERPETRWYAGGVQAMPITAKELGLDRDWQSRVIAAVGNYGDIFDRNIGKNSPLKLDRGLNANQLNGGLFLSPFIE